MAFFVRNSKAFFPRVPIILVGGFLLCIPVMLLRIPILYVKDLCLGFLFFFSFFFTRVPILWVDELFAWDSQLFVSQLARVPILFALKVFY